MNHALSDKLFITVLELLFFGMALSAAGFLANLVKHYWLMVVLWPPCFVIFGLMFYSIWFQS